VTLVAVWIAEGSINAIADTRIIRSAGNILTEHGPKILPLSVVCKQPGTAGWYDKVMFAGSVGFAYSGSTLSALATHALADVFTSHLIGNPDAQLPSLHDIAIAAGKIARQYMQDVGQLAGPDALFTATIFGHCPQLERLRIFEIAPQLSSSAVQVTVTEFDTSDPDNVLIFGSCPDLLRQRIHDVRSAAEHQVVRDRAPMHALQSIIDDNSNESVGGSLQLAWVTSAGFEIVALAVWIPAKENGRNMASLILGFDIGEADHIGQYKISTTGLASGSPKPRGS
jgi:hypothetical protein